MSKENETEADITLADIYENDAPRGDAVFAPDRLEDDDYWLPGKELRSQLVRRSVR
ncbi:hypothetical protein [Reyranella sp.]|uniref:hypothetical protein n=1 Tax=Reyranella sp. TaxID=1929291 RepID=UPI003D0E6449